MFVERVCCVHGFGGEHKFGWTRAVRWVGVYEGIGGWGYEEEEE